MFVAESVNLQFGCFPISKKVSKQCCIILLFILNIRRTANTQLCID